MAITTMDGIVAGLNDAQRIRLHSNSFTTAAGFFYNIQNSANTTSFGLTSLPTDAASGGSVHSAGDAGFPSISSVVGKRYLAGFDVFCTLAQTAIGLYDRVWSCSGFSGTVTTPQAVTGFPSLPARAGTGEGLEIWIECYTAFGSTTTIDIVVEYTNNFGISGRTTTVSPLSNVNGARVMLKLILQAGDIGVQSVQSVTLSASTGTAGNFGVTLMLPIAASKSSGNTIKPVVNDFSATFFPKIADGSALQLVGYNSINGSSGSITLIDG